MNERQREEEKMKLFRRHNQRMKDINKFHVKKGYGISTSEFCFAVPITEIPYAI